MVLIDFYDSKQLNKIIQKYQDYFGDESWTDIGKGFTFSTINWDKNKLKKLDIYIDSHIENNIRISQEKFLSEFLQVPDNANI